MDYKKFLDSKQQLEKGDSIKMRWMPDCLFDFQKALLEWSLWKGRCATFADCGLGKTPLQLTWAQNVFLQTKKPVLLITPLAVSYQTIKEAKKFGVEAALCRDKIKRGVPICITNYQRLHHFDPKDF